MKLEDLPEEWKGGWRVLAKSPDTTLQIFIEPDKRSSRGQCMATVWVGSGYEYEGEDMTSDGMRHTAQVLLEAADKLDAVNAAAEAATRDEEDPDA